MCGQRFCHNCLQILLPLLFQKKKLVNIFFLVHGECTKRGMRRKVMGSVRHICTVVCPKIFSWNVLNKTSRTGYCQKHHSKAEQVPFRCCKRDRSVLRAVGPDITFRDQPLWTEMLRSTSLPSARSALLNLHYLPLLADTEILMSQIYTVAAILILLRTGQTIWPQYHCVFMPSSGDTLVFLHGTVLREQNYDGKFGNTYRVG
jgi:hypothetical protein